MSIAAGAVLGTLGGEVVKTASVPVEAWRQHQTARIRRRLERTSEGARHLSGERPLEPSDRVAFKALAEAALTDDELMADYLGGVLAASSSENDAGVPVVALLGRMSSLQLRFHYLIYRAARELWPRDARVNLYRDKENPRLLIPRLALVSGTGLMDVGLHVSSTLYALHREGLVNTGWTYGPPKEDDAAEYEATVQTTAAGSELFLWGHGIQPPLANRLFESDLDLGLLTDVPPASGVCPLNRLAPTA